MKRLQLQRWSRSVLSPSSRTMPGAQLYLQVNAGLRRQSTASTAIQTPEEDQAIDRIDAVESQPKPQYPKTGPRHKPTLLSSKVFALHARLSLPSKLPPQTLARTLLDASAEPHPKFNNSALAVLGHDLLAYYTTEHLLCTFPRLPMTVLYAAMYAYVGPKTLAVIAGEWGVELAAVPGPEVDSGLLQFQRVNPGEEIVMDRSKTTRPHQKYRKTVTSSVIYDDIFGDPDLKSQNPIKLAQNLPGLEESIAGVTAEQATSTFVKALVGAIYLHAGRPAAKKFFQEHILSRHLDVSKLFVFTKPVRDLVKLCGRENFNPPVAKIISETGRHSRHPVFLVGVFSGEHKLGEGTGASLVEARTRAAIAALKGWYLYSPVDVKVPSSMEESGARPWKPVYVDPGEVFV